MSRKEEEILSPSPTASLTKSWLPRWEKTKSQLMDLLEAQRLPHALLFRGPLGTGKREVANRFARAALEKFTLAAPDMFGGAPGSTGPNFDKEYPDLRWIKPVDDVIKVDQVKDLPKELSYAPFESSCRFVVIEDADLLNQQAANAILKVLEEAPAQTFFILTSRDRSLVLPTIASRCQDVRFSPLSEAEMKELGFEEITPAAEGSFKKLELIRKAKEANIWTEPADLLLKALSLGVITIELSKFLEEIDYAGAQIVLESWIAVGRDLSIGSSAEKRGYYHGELRELIRRVREQGKDFEKLGAVCEEGRRMMDLNVNPRLALESVLAQLLTLS